MACCCPTMELTAPPCRIARTHFLSRPRFHHVNLFTYQLKPRKIKNWGILRAVYETKTDRRGIPNDSCFCLVDTEKELPANEWIVRRFSTSLHSKPPPKQNEEFYINTGYAIRALREELPSMFYRELTLDIYRYDRKP